MPHLSTTRPPTCVTCVTCELEIIGSPTFHLGLPFCCAGCAADGPCSCSYDQEAIDDPHVRYCLDVTEPIAVIEPIAPARVAADRVSVGAAGR